MKWKYLYLSLISSLFLCGSARAQDQVRIYSSVKAIEAKGLEAWIKERYAFDIDIRWFHSDSSLTGVHHSYYLQVNDIAIHHGLLRYHSFTDGSALITAPVIDMTEAPLSEPLSEGVLARWMKSQPFAEVLHHEQQWKITEDGWQAVWLIRFRVDGIQYETILNEDAEPMALETRSLFDKEDSTVAINIYQPDPITVTESTYGELLRDNNDAASEALINAMQQDSIQLRWIVEEGKWFLISDHARAADFHNVLESNNPNVDPPSFLAPTSDSLEVDRSQAAFEYFNTFFHIHQAKEWMQKLGFNNLVDYPIAFDAHASEADQSSFEPLGDNSRLRFGDGGVDDAEDADVIVHEYGHAISYSAAPETNFGGERASLDEGFCDYLAISYSRRISDFGSKRVFNWDGHNEFWDGRTLTDNRTYPTDKQNNIYSDGILWASALEDIASLIGFEETDQIMINSLYTWYPNMLLSDAAALFIRSDSMLNDGAYSEVAEIVFCGRGLLKGCEDTLINTLPISEPYIGNSFDFAFNNEPLYIYPNGNEIELLEVLDMHGRLIYEEEWTSTDRFYSFEGANMRQGAFVIRLLTTEGPIAFKVIRTSIR